MREMVPIQDFLKVHYGKALKEDGRDGSGTFEVFGSSGFVGNHNKTLVDFPTIIIGRKGSVGAITYAPNGGWPIDTTFYVEPINSKQIDLRYLFYAFKNAKLARHTITTSIPGLNRNDIYKTEIPLPPLAEQQRIAAILDQADALRTKRRAALAKLDTLLQATFLDMFGDPVTNPMGWEVVKLSEISDVDNGVTKSSGRIRDKKTVTLPYMRVANVQDGKILTGIEDVKFIEILLEDAEKYLLRSGDILLTEGGDPDKLGRGGIWKGEIDPCIHQNHIFRVRISDNNFLPEYLSALIGSWYGKKYFLKAAKQTTGIATINKTQLQAFPVQRANIDIQYKFSQFVKKLETQKLVLETNSNDFTNLFHALQQRAFQGEL